MATELIAYKSNALIEASYKLTLQEQRLLLACISKINPLSKNPEKQFQLAANDFYLMFPDMGKANAERHLQDAINRLADRWIFLRNPKEQREIRWIQEKAKYFNREGKIEIIFSDSIMPYLTQLTQQFTAITVKNVSALKKTYSIRIYELLIQFKQTGNRLIPIEDFRSMLDLDSKYKDFKILNRAVIKPAIKELNEKSDLFITVSILKKGKKATFLQFQFEKTKIL